MLLSLNCFVLCDDPDQIFTVEIEKNDNVGILRDLIIKNASCLKHVDVPTLELWQVDISRDNLTQLVNFKPDSSLKLLLHEQLFTIFKDEITDENIHVIVKAPGMSQQCSLWIYF